MAIASTALAAFDHRPFFDKALRYGVEQGIITPERLKSQSFTQPYYDSDIGVATKTDSAVTGLADLKGKTFAKKKCARPWQSACKLILAKLCQPLLLLRAMPN